MALLDDHRTDNLVGSWNDFGNQVWGRQRSETRTVLGVGRRRSVILGFQRNVRENSKNLVRETHKWADSALVDAYRQGTVQVYGARAYNLNAREQRQLGSIVNDVKVKATRVGSYVTKDVDRFAKDVRAHKGEITSNWLGRNGVKGYQTKSGRRYRAEAYMEMQMRSANQRAYNLGVVNASQKAKIRFLEVQDGPSCGWDGHEDSDTANGKIVTFSDARSHLISHPYCVRQFIPRPDLSGKDVEKGSGRIGKAIASFAVAQVGTSGLKVLSSLLFVVEDDILDPDLADVIMLGAAADDKIGLFYKRIFNQFMGLFKTGPGGEVVPLHFPPPPPSPVAPAVVAGLENMPAAIQAEGRVLWPIISGMDFARGLPNTFDSFTTDVLKWGDQFLDKRWKVPELPDFVKRMIGATNNDSDATVGRKFLNFGKWVQRTREREIAIEGGARILNFTAKKRHWNEFQMLRGFPRLESAIRATWTKYGPRTRIDLTDFMRGNITVTKTGLRRSITFNPAGAVRGMLGLSQDGTLIGNLRLVPHRIFRAVVEVDEFGRLVGNVRLVPSGPFKIMMRFQHPRPHAFDQFGMVKGEDFLDLRGSARALAGRTYPWIADTSRLQGFEMLEKWGKDRNFRNLWNKIKAAESGADDGAFETAVFAGVEGGRPNSREVRDWLAVVLDGEDLDETLYDGDILKAADFGTFETREQFLDFLQNEWFEKNQRHDKWFGIWSNDRLKASRAFRTKEPKDVSVLYRVKGMPGMHINGDRFAGGSAFIVDGTRYNKKTNQLIVDLFPLQNINREVLGGRRFGLDDFSFRDLYGVSRGMELKDIIIEAAIFKRTPFQLAADFRIPVKDVKTYIRKLHRRGWVVHNPDGTYTGTFQYIAKGQALEDLKEFLQTKADRQRIFGTISFSQMLPKWLGFFDPKATAGLHWKHGQFQDVIANIRLSGMRWISEYSKIELGHMFHIDSLADTWKEWSDAIDRVDNQLKLWIVRNRRQEIVLLNGRPIQIKIPAVISDLGGNLLGFGWRSLEEPIFIRPPRLVVPPGVIVPEWLRDKVYSPWFIGKQFEERLDNIIIKDPLAMPPIFRKAPGRAGGGFERTEIVGGIPQKVGGPPPPSSWTVEEARDYRRTLLRSIHDEIIGSSVVRQVTDANRTVIPLVPKIRQRWIKKIAGIQPTDPNAVVEYKLRQMLLVLKARVIDDDELKELFDQISDNDIRVAGRVLTNKNILEAEQKKLVDFDGPLQDPRIHSRPQDYDPRSTVVVENSAWNHTEAWTRDEVPSYINTDGFTSFIDMVPFDVTATEEQVLRGTRVIHELMRAKGLDPEEHLNIRLSVNALTDLSAEKRAVTSAFYDYETQTINVNALGMPDWLDEGIRLKAQTGTAWREDGSIIAHEIGHHLSSRLNAFDYHRIFFKMEQQFGFEINDTFRALATTDYGGTNDHEFFAEAFSVYIAGNPKAAVGDSDRIGPVVNWFVNEVLDTIAEGRPNSHYLTMYDQNYVSTADGPGDLEIVVRKWSSIFEDHLDSDYTKLQQVVAMDLSDAGHHNMVIADWLGVTREEVDEWVFGSKRLAVKETRDRLDALADGRLLRHDETLDNAGFFRMGDAERVRYAPEEFRAASEPPPGDPLPPNQIPPPNTDPIHYPEPIPLPPSSLDDLNSGPTYIRLDESLPEGDSRPENWNPHNKRKVPDSILENTDPWRLGEIPRNYNMQEFLNHPDVDIESEFYKEVTKGIRSIHALLVGKGIDPELVHVILPGLEDLEDGEDWAAAYSYLEGTLAINLADHPQWLDPNWRMAANTGQSWRPDSAIIAHEMGHHVTSLMNVADFHRLMVNTEIAFDRVMDEHFMNAATTEYGSTDAFEFFAENFSLFVAGSFDPGLPFPTGATDWVGTVPSFFVEEALDIISKAPRATQNRDLWGEVWAPFETEAGGKPWIQVYSTFWSHSYKNFVDVYDVEGADDAWRRLIAWDMHRNNRRPDHVIADLVGVDEDKLAFWFGEDIAWTKSLHEEWYQETAERMNERMVLWQAKNDLLDVYEDIDVVRVPPGTTEEDFFGNLETIERRLEESGQLFGEEEIGQIEI